MEEKFRFTFFRTHTIGDSIPKRQTVSFLPCMAKILPFATEMLPEREVGNPVAASGLIAILTIICVTPPKLLNAPQMTGQVSHSGKPHAPELVSSS